MNKMSWILGMVLGMLVKASIANASVAAIVLNGYAAKDYCSCRFVTGQTKKHCKKQIGVGFPLPHGQIHEFEVDETSTMVTVGKNHPQNVRVAYYTGTRLGCRLLPPGVTEIND